MYVSQINHFSHSALRQTLGPHEEGCLSIPGHTADVSRPDWIKLRFTDIKGKEQQIKAEGLLAACIQHEIDHLNGILFIDHISKLKRDIIWRKVLKEARQT